MIFKKISKKSNKKVAQQRSSDSSYQKQRAYHYSSVRSDIERNMGRSRTEYPSKLTKENSSGTGRKSLFVSRLKHILIIIACLVVCGMLSYLNTDSIELQNNGVKLPLDQVAANAKQYLGDSNLNKAKLTLKRKGLEKYLKSHNNYISDVDVSTKIFSTKVYVKVTLNQPSLVVSDGSRVFLVADNGLILSDITNNKDKDITQLNLPLVQDQTAVRLEVGKPALSQDQVNYIKEIIFQTDKSGLKTESINLAEGGSQINVRYGGLGYYVKYNFYEDARRSAGAFLATRKQIEEDKTQPSEYVDVRVAERAYVK